MTSYNVTTCVTREIVSPPGEFVLAWKNSHRVHGSSTADCYGSPVNFDIARPTLPFLPFSSPHAPMVRGTKDSVPRWGNLLGTRRRSSRRNLGSSVSFPSRFFVFSYPPLDVLPPCTLLCSPSTGFANYPSPGTLILRVRRRTGQEERNLNMFGSERYCLVYSQMLRRGESICILRLSTHGNIVRRTA